MRIRSFVTMFTVWTCVYNGYIVEASPEVSSAVAKSRCTEAEIDRFDESTYLDVAHVGEVYRCCRRIRYIAHGRVHSFKDPWVYDAKVTDTLTRIACVARHADSIHEAAEKGADYLVEHLNDLGYIKGTSCSVDHLPSTISSTDPSCMPGGSVPCGSTCHFTCVSPSDQLVGESSVKCCDNETFVSSIPTCQARRCKLPPDFTEGLGTTDGLCLPDDWIDAGATCNFKCDPGYTLIGRAQITCRSDGRLSWQLPYCQRQDKAPTTPTSAAAGKTTQLKPVTGSKPFTDAVTSPPSPTPSSSVVMVTTLEASSKRATEIKHHSQGDTAKGKIHPLYIIAPVIAVVFSFILFVAGRHWRKKSKSGNKDMYKGVCPDNDGYYMHHKVRKTDPCPGQLNTLESYDMSHPKKGIAFILNNNNFPGGNLRAGSYIDVTNVRHVFRELGYQPEVCESLTSEQLKTALSELILRIEASHTSLVLYLMTTGNDQGVVGTDGNFVSIDDIKDNFSAENCAVLQNKPKIIFLQTVPWDISQQEIVGGAMLQNSLNQAAASGEKPSGEDLALRESAGNLCETDGFLREGGDNYIVHADLEKYFSMRPGVNGSWFVQVLSEEILLRAHSDDLDAIMTGVTRRVAKDVRTLNFVQPPQIIKQGICRHIYFMPKCEERPLEDSLQLCEDDDELLIQV
ncbi:uncharacterized protein [Diadema antillarum]|uniref:uncharacterized protein n=1 Tax=Diadema antillarum TaxID=105358 RepID=UPI003A84C2E9